MSIFNSLLIAGFLVIGATACKDKEQKTESRADTLVTDSDNNGPDYSTAEVLETVYVTKRGGLDAKEQANEGSKTLASYDYGRALPVIEVNGPWLGIKDMVRKVDQNGESNTWEKVYVLKSSTGSMEEVKLAEEDLNIICYLKTKDKEEYLDGGKPLTSYLKFELIDKSLFESQQATGVNFLLEDTTAVVKVNGTIELKCTQKNKYYKDKDTDNDDMEHYTYVGQIPSLNKYLVTGSYWEAFDYKLIDKTSGEQTQSLVYYPHISPDQKYIICMSCNPYESTTDLELYSIADQQTKLLMNASFNNWVQGYNKGDIFWSTDGYLYVTASHMATMGDMDSDKIEKQYMRIKVL